MLSLSLHEQTERFQYWEVCICSLSYSSDN